VNDFVAISIPLESMSSTSYNTSNPDNPGGQEAAESCVEDVVKSAPIAVAVAATDCEQISERVLDTASVIASTKCRREDVVSTRIYVEDEEPPPSKRMNTNQRSNEREQISNSGSNTTSGDQGNLDTAKYKDEICSFSANCDLDVHALLPHHQYWKSQSEGLARLENVTEFLTYAKEIPRIMTYASSELTKMESLENEIKSLNNELEVLSNELEVLSNELLAIESSTASIVTEEYMLEMLNERQRVFCNKLESEDRRQYLADMAKSFIKDKEILIRDKEILIRDKKILIRDKKILIRDKEILIKDQIGSVNRRVVKVFHQAYVVDSWVRTLSALNQADTATSRKSVKDQCSSGLSNSDAKSSDICADDQLKDRVSGGSVSRERVFGEHDGDQETGNSAKKVESYSFHQVEPEPGFVLRHLYKNGDIFKGGIFDEEVLGNSEGGDTSILKKISDAYNEAVEGYASSALQPQTTDGQMEKSAPLVLPDADQMGKLLEWFTEVASGSTRSAKSWFNGPPYFPGPSTAEKKGVQKVLPYVWLLFGGSLKSNDSRTRSSPPKSNVRSEKRMPKTEHRKRRVVDAVVSVRAAHHAKIIRDDASEVMVEFKTAQRADKSPLQLIDAQREQLVGHLSKQNGRCLHFGGGVGVPCFVTGIIAGLGYLQILQLGLVDPGTPNSRLTLHATRLLPLMTKENFELWYKSDAKSQKYEAEWIKLKKFLYPENKEEVVGSSFDDTLLKRSPGHVVDKSQILLGWKAIWSVMTARRQELFGAWGPEVSKNFGTVIGFGSFASVFNKNNCNRVIKVSTHGNIGHIQNEVKHLKLLKPEQSEYPELVAQYKRSGFRVFSIGNVKISLPFVETSPHGVSLYFELLKLDRGQQDYWDLIKSISEGMEGALEFIHQHEVCHNDISDKNIVLKNFKPVLVDFGNAACFNDKKTRFYGTTEFAHRQIHFATTWYCRREYDLTSLGFTMATILNDGMVVWNGFSSGPVGDKKSPFFDQRIKCARDIVSNKTLISETRSELKVKFTDWIAFDSVYYDKPTKGQPGEI